MAAHQSYRMLHYRKATIPLDYGKINFQNMQVSIGIQRANIKEIENDVSKLCTNKATLGSMTDNQ